MISTDIHGRPRRGDWIQTYTGKQFFPLCPTFNDYDITDIAAALSKLTRYGGHCFEFYSVAEHCVIMFLEAARQGLDKRALRAVLMHDASEAYLIDVPRPIKGELAEYKSIENGLMLSLAQAFDFDWPMPEIVKILDECILNDEMAQAMASPPAPWKHGGKPLGIALKFWPPRVAMAHFLSAAKYCGIKIT